MKTLSLKLDEEVFQEVEKLTSLLGKARNRYINDALKMYNEHNKRQALKKQLVRESKLVRKNSMAVLQEFDEIDEQD